MHYLLFCRAGTPRSSQASAVTASLIHVRLLLLNLVTTRFFFASYKQTMHLLCRSEAGIMKIETKNELTGKRCLVYVYVYMQLHKRNTIVRSQPIRRCH